MSHKRSIVHPFFPLNVQFLEKNFSRISFSISENQHKKLLYKTSKTKYESSNVNYTTIFTFNVQVLKKNYSRKSCPISEN